MITSTPPVHAVRCFLVLHKVFQLRFLDKSDSVISCIVVNMYFLQTCPQQLTVLWDVKTESGNILITL